MRSWQWEPLRAAPWLSGTSHGFAIGVGIGVGFVVGRPVAGCRGRGPGERHRRRSRPRFPLRIQGRRTWRAAARLMPAAASWRRRASAWLSRWTS